MYRIIFASAVCLSLLACDQQPVSVSNNSTVALQEFVNMDEGWTSTFLRDEGVFGVDGIFAVPLNGKEFEAPSSDKDSTIFIFSDSLIKGEGKIKNKTLGNDEYKMVHNSLGLAVGTDPQSSLEFHYRTANSKPTTMFVPPKEAREKDHYYWLGDGFVNTAADSSLYIFAYEIIDLETDGFFSFDQLGVSILKIDKEEKFPYENYEVMETDLMFRTGDVLGNTTFGNAILVNTKEAGAPFPDGYIYVYGCGGYQKDLYVTRVLPKDFDDMKAWMYWDGKGWSSDRKNVKKLTSGVSNEMSVSPLPNGQFILIFQDLGMESRVMMQLSKSPVGPFYPPKALYSCPEVLEDKDFFAYNAKGHPSISPKDSLVISYNVNSFDFFKDILTKPNLYRPRFITMSLN